METESACFDFATSIDAPLDINNLKHRHFRDLLKISGIRQIRLYDPRHTAATLMLAAGVNPRCPSERLGHSTITLTVDTYSHVQPDMQRDAVDRSKRFLAASIA